MRLGHSHFPYVNLNSLTGINRFFYYVFHVINLHDYICGMYLKAIFYQSNYRPERSWGQGNIFTPVCHSFCSQGGSASVHAGIPPPPRQQTPQSRYPPPPEQTPQEQTPPEQTPPGSRHPPPPSRLQHTVYERPVRILLECILVHE